MKIQELNSFLAVCRYGSFTRAAEKTFTTQPTISWHISALEKELGKQLFVRSKGIHKIVLTSAGEILYKQAEKISLIWAETEQMLAEDKEKPYSVSCVPSLQRFLFPHLTAAFHEQFPDCNLTLGGDTSYDSPAMVEDGRSDAAIVCTILPDRQYYHVQPVAQEKMFCVSRGDSPYGAQVKVSELRKRNLINSRWYTAIPEWFAQYFPEDEKPLVNLQTPSSLPEYFTKPEAWSAVPATMLYHYPKDFKIGEFDNPPPPRKIFLISKEPLRQPYYEILLNSLRERLSQIPHVELLNEE